MDCVHSDAIDILLIRYSNRFDTLDLEDIQTDLADSSLAEESVSSSTSVVASKKLNELYDFADAQPEDETLFAIFCFFEDIHTVQKKIHDAWRRFANGETSLAVATIATQASLDIVKRLENEMIDVIPVTPLTKDASGYHTLAGPLLLAEAQSRGESLRDLSNYRRGFRQGQYDEYLFVSAFDTLDKFLETVKHWRKTKQPWPPWPVRPLEYTYISKPALYHRPEIRSRIEEDRFLTQLLMDTLLFEDRIAHHYSVHSGKSKATDYRHDLPLIQDELSRCVTLLTESGQISLHTVFTAQIVLDVSHICSRGSQSLPRAALREASDHADHVFPHKMNDDGEIDDLDFAWNSNDEHAGLAIYKLASNSFASPPIGAMKRFFLRELAVRNPYESMIRSLRNSILLMMRANGLDPENLSEEHSWMADITPLAHSEDPEFQLKNNALFTGSTMIELIMCLEAAGLCIANTHMTIFTTAHLYNALRRMGVTDLHWPEMDRVIDVHKATIFANDMPHTSQEILRRLQYRTGMAPKAKWTKKAAKRVEDAWQLKPSAASTALRNALEKRESIEHTMLLLENQLDQRFMQSYRPRTSLAQSRRQKQRQSPVQLLSRLEEYLPEVLEDMQIDYITWTKTRNALMVAVQKALEEEHGLKLVDLPRITNEGFRVKNVEYMFLLLQVFELNCESEQAHRKEKCKTPFAGGEELRTGGRTFERFFDEEIRADVRRP